MQALSQRFQHAMAGFGPWEASPHLAVAVSGGADSMALCLLAHAWAQPLGGTVTALTIDHGLRPEAAIEARHVADWLTQRGISHVTLAWEGEKPSSSLQAAARHARYRLLEDYCHRHALLHLLTAHHADDQAETFWQRLSHGSGPTGLACMASCVEKPGHRLLRPLLREEKTTLFHWLQEQNQPWIEDPSNDSTAYQRNRVRHWQKGLEEEGLSSQRLHSVILKQAQLRQWSESSLWQAMVSCCHLSSQGEAFLSWPLFSILPEALHLPLWSRLLTVIGGETDPPREEKLTRLLTQWRDKGPDSTTLHGCLIRYDQKRRLMKLLPEKTRNPLAKGAMLHHIREREDFRPPRPLTDAGFTCAR